MDEELDKLADDLYNGLVGKSSQKGKESSQKGDTSNHPESSKPTNTKKENSMFSPEVENFVERLRKDGFDVPDNWEELVSEMERATDSFFGNDFEDTDEPMAWDMEMDEEDIHAELYAFEFEYMPALAETDWIDDSSRDVCLGDKAQVLANAAERDIMIDPQGFKINHEQRDCLDVFIYEFPQPPRSPFALYGAIIFGRMGGRYYTLEQAHSGYMVCGQTSDTHYNYGIAENISKEHFIKTAIGLYKANV